MQQDIVKFSMSSQNNKVNDINLYIYDEKTLYTKLHTHSFFEIIIVTQGKVFQNVNGTEYIMSKNDVCILRPESLHKISPYNDEPILLFNFEVDIHYLTSLFAAFGYSSCDEILSSPSTFLQCRPEDIISFLNTIITPTKTFSSLQFANKQSSLKVIVANIILKVISNQNIYSLKNITDPIIMATLSYLGNADYFNLSIKEICKKTFYSQEHITRLFAKANLDSPNKIHLQNKLHYSAYLLLNTNMKIIDIIDHCGIKTMSYFNKAFKNEYGITPHAYKKTYKPYLTQQLKN